MNWEFDWMNDEFERTAEISFTTEELTLLIYEKTAELNFFFLDILIKPEEKSLYVELIIHGKDSICLSSSITGAEKCCNFIERFVGLEGATFSRKQTELCYQTRGLTCEEDEEGNVVTMEQKIESLNSFLKENRNASGKK